MTPGDARNTVDRFAVALGAPVMDALRSLSHGFIDSDAMFAMSRVVAGEDVPEPFAGLLVHCDHMTTTLRDYHGADIRLHVLEHRFDAETDSYARKILLTESAGGAVVEFGLVRIDLAWISPEARVEILDRVSPLGDILIRHNILREIEPLWFLEFSSDAPPQAYFEHGDSGSVLWGRIGVIHCDGAPAIRLLEIVTGARADRDSSGGSALGAGED